MTNLFSAINVVCAREQCVLFPAINFHLGLGESLHIIGKNGTGKSTLLRCLAGLSRPFSGEIYWCDQLIFDNEVYKEELFFLGHKNTIKNSLTAYENLLYSTILLRKVAPQEVDGALRQAGLESKRNIQAGLLSSGQKQRLALSKLLLSKAKIWILDEPFTALDSEGIEWVETLFLNHTQRQGLLIYTSHQRFSSSKYEKSNSLELHSCPQFERVI